MRALLIFIFWFCNACWAQSLSPEAHLFAKYRDGIVTVLGDEGRGSGFLIDKNGLLLTNHHVVLNSLSIQVEINDSLRVYADCISMDRQKDVAVLRVHPKFIRDLAVLPLCKNAEAPLIEGEHVVALGNPLRQTKIITAGIISKVEEGAIFSDVNINPGSSGGPLLNMQGEVVAINTFGDFSSIGPGIAGSIPISSAFDVIAAAREQVQTQPPPSENAVSLLPAANYPLWGYEMAFLKLPASEWRHTGSLASYGGVIAYDHLKRIKTPVYCFKSNGLSIAFFTPPFIYKIKNFYRSKLNQLITESNRVYQSQWSLFYDPFETIKGWMQSTGHTASSVIITVIPLPRHTTSSAYNPAENTYLLSRDTPSVNELGSAVVDVYLRIDDKPAMPVDRYFKYTSYYFIRTDEKALQRVDEISRMSAFAYSYTDFAPSGTEWPKVELDVLLAENPNDTLCIQIPQQTLEQVWYDFEPLRLQQQFDRLERK